MRYGFDSRIVHLNGLIVKSNQLINLSQKQVLVGSNPTNYFIMIKTFCSIVSVFSRIGVKEAHNTVDVKEADRYRYAWLELLGRFYTYYPCRIIISFL